MRGGRLGGQLFCEGLFVAYDPSLAVILAELVDAVKSCGGLARVQFSSQQHDEIAGIGVHAPERDKFEGVWWLFLLVNKDRLIFELRNKAELGFQIAAAGKPAFS